MAESKTSKKNDDKTLSSLERARRSRSSTEGLPTRTGVANVPAGKTARLVDLSIDDENRLANLRAHLHAKGFDLVPREEWGKMRPLRYNRCEIWLADEQCEDILFSARLAKVMERKARFQGRKLDPDEAIAMAEDKIEAERAKAFVSRRENREKIKDFLN